MREFLLSSIFISCREAQHISHHLISTPQFPLFWQIRQPLPTRLLDHLKTFSHQLLQLSWHDRHHAAMLSIVIGPVDIEYKTAYIAQQHHDASNINQFAQQVQVGLDDTHAKGLRGFLVVPVTLLLAKIVGGDTLHLVKDIKQRITEELREDQRADDNTEFSGSQTWYLWRVWNRTLLQAMRSSFKNGLSAPWHKRCPLLPFDHAAKANANPTAYVTLQQAHSFV